MTLEDELRQLFAARAAGVRAADDPAGRAIRRARVVRRRRAVGSGTAAALILVAALGGAVVLHPTWPDNKQLGREAVLAPGGPELLDTAPPPAMTPTPQPTTGKLTQRVSALAPEARIRLLHVDLRVDDELWNDAGDRLALTDVGRVTRVYRVPLGWVYGGDQEVRLLRRDGTRVRLGSLGPDWLVSAAGDRVAYVQSQRLTIASLAKRGLEPKVAVLVPEGTRPVAFVGSETIVVAGGTGLYGVLPSSDAVRPVWSETVVSVYGAARGTVVGQVKGAKGGQVCLATLAAGQRGLVPLRTGACRSQSTSVAAGDAAGAGGDAEPGGKRHPATRATAVLAPDGEWLAEHSGDKLLLTHVNTAVSGKKASVPCPTDGTVTPVWTDGTTLLASDGDRAIHCRTTGDTEATPLPDGLTGRDWAFVPELPPPTAQ